MDDQIDTFFKIKTIKIIVFIYFFGFYSVNTFAQLGFCGGNSGDPIFTETFGTGTTNTPLPAGTTTYNFTTNNPQDGFYTVSNNTGFYDWHNTTDHTIGDTNGKCLIVNGDFIVGEFYRTTITGLCENTSYEFSSWLLNLLPTSGCGGNGIPVNVKFQIWDNTNTNLLASGDTSNIFGSSTPNWEQYALVFQTLVGQTSVILKMINNSIGGCGNDLAIDDIVFKSCGDFVSINDTANNANISICSSQTPYSTNLIVTPDNSVFNTHFYQWEESVDGVVWTDITGETNQNIAISGITTSMFYRAKVAESAINLNNSLCNIASEVFQVVVNQAPTQPTLECWETAIINSATCSWEISGTQPVQPTLECWETATFNNTICDWEISGVQPIQPTGLACWESTTFNNTTCVWDIFGTQPIQPTLECWETAAFNNTTCVWDISGVQPTQPTGLACWETATFNNTACDWEISGTQPVQPTLECWETTTFNTTTCVWDISGVQPNQPTGLACWETASFNSTTCDWEISGVQPMQPIGLACWEIATFNTTTCVWDVTGTQTVDLIEEFLSFCSGDEITMQAYTDILNPTFLWNTGETSAFKTVASPGTYTVETTDNCITIVKTIYVEELDTPIINTIFSDGNEIIVETLNQGDFEYSLDGNLYQLNNTFINTEGGLYTIYVKERNGCGVATLDYLHFVIPKYFTPNNDGENETFDLKGIQYFNTSQVAIFDRYGKLLISSKNAPFSWDGTFNNTPLPTSDYWYIITIEGQKFTGHFTLKR